MQLLTNKTSPQIVAELSCFGGHQGKVSGADQKGCNRSRHRACLVGWFVSLLIHLCERKVLLADLYK